MEFGWVFHKLERFWTRLWRYKSMVDVIGENWELMPDVVVIEIFKYLTDRERLNMALACKRWANLFNTPCLWRVRHFDMGGYRSQYNGNRANKFVEKLGAYIKYLSISCSHPSYHTTKIFQKSVEDLLSSKLRNSQLVEFELERLEMERYWKQEASRERFTSFFVRFFKHQKFLKVFDMTAAQFTVGGGFRILEAIGMQAGETLEEMFIEDFFPGRTALYQMDKLTRVMSRFTNLNYLAINYNCLSDSILEILSQNLVGLLRTLNIKVYRNDPHMHRISGTTWKNLSTACPSLTVTFWFDSIGHADEICPILVKEIPVIDIHLWTGYDDDSEWDTERTLNRITNSYKDSLEAVSLEIDNSHEFIDSALLRMVSTCKHLRDVSINAIVMVETVEKILQMESERKIHLHSLNVTACSLSDTDWLLLAEIRDRFADMAKDHNVDLRISTDLVFDTVPM